MDGGIPSELGGLANLTDLILSQNQLSGEIPRHLGNIRSLKMLDLRSNHLGGADTRGIRRSSQPQIFVSLPKPIGGMHTQTLD